MRKKIVLTVILTFILAVSAFAQFDVGLNLTIISPESGFKENVDRLGWGGSGKFSVKLGNSPFYAGLNIGIANYGSDSRREPFSTTIPDVTVEVTRNNNIMFSHLLLQAKRDIGFLQPYVEGLFGFNYLWTETKIDDDDWEEDDIASDTNFDDFALSYGAGFGISIRLKDGFEIDSEDATTKGSFFLDLGVRYMAGGEAEYLKKGSITIDDNNKVHYNVSKSDTDLISYHIGVSVKIY